MVFLFSCFPDTRYSNSWFLKHWKVQKAILTINLQRPIILYYSIYQQHEGPCVLIMSGWSRWLLYYCMSQQSHLATEKMHLCILHSNFLQKWKQCIKKKFIRCSRELVSHMNSLIASTGVDMTKTEEVGTETMVSDCDMQCRCETKN